MPTVVEPLSQGAADYLRSFDLRAVCQSEGGRIFISDNPKNAVTAFWCRAADASRVAEAAWQVGDIMAVRDVAQQPLDGLDRRTRAFLLVQQGCDHRCTFCSIPFGRGQSRSVPLPEVVAQARALLAGGHVELTVTGVDIASYGRDLPGHQSLGAMLEGLLAEVPELRRLRLSSLDPAAIDPDLHKLVAGEPRLLPHLQRLLQSIPRHCQKARECT